MKQEAEKKLQLRNVFL